MKIDQNEFLAKAKEINDSIFGPKRDKKVKLLDAAKIQANESAKFALEKAFSAPWLSAAMRNAFLEVLREQKDAINVLLVSGDQKQKSIEIIKPIFGQKSGDFIDNFQKAFKAMEAELQADMKTLRAG